MVTSARCLADVGTDHGYIPIYLVEEGIVSSAIAMDINKGPLQRASENIERHGLSGRIGTRLSDGLKALAPGEADCVVIAGMGGGLVKKILTEGREALESVRELILQPQSELEEVRRFLWEQGYVTEAEEMVLEDGKYYPMMRLRPPYAAGETEGGPGRDGKTKRRDLAGNCEEAKSREAAVNCDCLLYTSPVYQWNPF